MLQAMAEAFAGFRAAEVKGIPAFYLRDHRFKTFRLTLTMRRPLDERAAARSLLSSLLLQGTTTDPDRPTLARRMESLYGATVAPGTGKIGESHLLRFALDCVAGDYLPDKPDQLGAGLSFLGEILSQPRLDGDGFPEEVFVRERRQAADAVRALFDDKGAYAWHQAVVGACEGEPMAIPEHGGIEAIEALDRQAPEAARKDFLAHGEACVIAMGVLPQDDGQLVQEIGRFLDVLPSREPQPMPRVTERQPSERRSTIERADLQQSKLVLVFRVPCTQDSRLWMARRLFSNMLGGGPHSRLFREVREKQSLAYYAHCSMDRHKGLMFVQVGLDQEAAGAVGDETQKQIAQLQAGSFGADELETARAILLSGLATIDDSIASRMGFVEEQWVLGTDRTPESVAKVYQEITADEVARSLEGLWLDYSYLLAPKNGATGK
jgi:predicted Zn-dependent peptidase